MLVFYGFLFCVHFYVVFVTSFSFCCFGCALLSKIKLFGFVLSFDFLVFFFLSFLDLSLVFKRINYLVFLAGLIRFGYRGLSFLSHAVSLWLRVFSKLRWLVGIII